MNNFIYRARITPYVFQRVKYPAVYTEIYEKFLNSEWEYLFNAHKSYRFGFDVLEFNTQQ